METKSSGHAQEGRDGRQGSLATREHDHCQPDNLADEGVAECNGKSWSSLYFNQLVFTVLFICFLVTPPHHRSHWPSYMHTSQIQIPIDTSVIITNERAETRLTDRFP